MPEGSPCLPKWKHCVRHWKPYLRHITTLARGGWQSHSPFAAGLCRLYCVPASLQLSRESSLACPQTLSIPVRRFHRSLTAELTTQLTSGMWQIRQPAASDGLIPVAAAEGRPRLVRVRPVLVRLVRVHVRPVLARHGGPLRVAEAVRRGGPGVAARHADGRRAPLVRRQGGQRAHLTDRADGAAVR